MRNLNHMNRLVTHAGVTALVIETTNFACIIHNISETFFFFKSTTRDSEITDTLFVSHSAQHKKLTGGKQNINKAPRAVGNTWTLDGHCSSHGFEWDCKLTSLTAAEQKDFPRDDCVDLKPSVGRGWTELKAIESEAGNEFYRYFNSGISTTTKRRRVGWTVETSEQEW